MVKLHHTNLQNIILTNIGKNGFFYITKLLEDAA